MGGQSELARAINDRFGAKTTTQQAIANLLKPAGKRPKRTSLVPFIAAVSGLPDPFTHLTVGPLSEEQGGPYAGSRMQPPIERAQEIDGVEFTKEALEVARAFMKLPDSLRAEFKQHIETEALKWSRAAAQQRVTQAEGSPAPKRRKRAMRSA